MNITCIILTVSNNISCVGSTTVTSDGIDDEVGAMIYIVAIIGEKDLITLLFYNYLSFAFYLLFDIIYGK